MCKPLLIGSVSVLFLLTSVTSIAGGSSRPTQKLVCETTPVAEPLPGGTLRLDPDVLRSRLLESNNDVILASNGVSIARDNLNVARAALIPVINVSGLALTPLNPTFLVSQVTALLPFLIPQNWFEVDRQSKMLESDKTAYKIAQMNVYASAYTAYQTLVSDQALQAIVASSVDDWRQIESVTRHQYDLGLVGPDVWTQVQGQRATAETRYEKVRAALGQELAAVRKMLALNPKVNLELAPVDVPPSNFENDLLGDATVKAANDRSLESEQLADLHSAAQVSKFSRFFGWLAGASVSTSVNTAASGSTYPKFSMDTLQVGGLLRFSMQDIPLIQLAQDNIKQIEIRQREIGLELNRVLDADKVTYSTIARRAELATEALDALRTSYLIILQKYQYGLGASLLDVINARTGLENSQIEALSAQTDLASLRIALHRMFLTDQFAKIQGCTGLVELPKPSTKTN